MLKTRIKKQPFISARVKCVVHVVKQEKYTFKHLDDKTTFYKYNAMPFLLL